MDIKRGLFADSYQSFEIDGQEVLYVLRENTTAITRGVAVLIADTGVSIVGRSSLSSVAQELNKIGWVTILLPAPDAGFLPQSKEMMADKEGSMAEDSTSMANNSAEPTNMEDGDKSEKEVSDISTFAHSKQPVSSLDSLAFEEHEKQLVALLQSSVGKSQEYPGFYLVIAKGTTAAWLTKIYADQKSPVPDAFVAISPFWPDRDYNKELPDLLAKTPMPVLDIYGKWDNEWALTTVATREIAATKALKLQYRQRQLLGFNNEYVQSLYLSKEIYGWLTHMGW